MRSHYRFDRSWHVDAAPDAVLRLLEDVRGYGAWWPAVRVTGGSRAPGARAGALEVRAPLGYRVRISLTETASDGPAELRATIAGDLEGWCAWRVTAEGSGSRVAFVEDVEARAPLLRLASPVLHGAFARQHAAVMRAAEHGLAAALSPPAAA